MNNIYKCIVKPVSDYLMALIILLLFSPIMLAITVVLLFTNNGKPFFTQQRPGKNEKVFNILKFKTMTDKKDKNGNLLPDGDRLTIMGKILRKTSLDELPQIINILKGDMSFIGPRPLLTNYLAYYTETEALRHTVKPGITGLAQVSGRNLIDWDDRLQLDVDYVKNLSFGLDSSIFIRTIKNVLIAKDVTVDATLHMESLENTRKKQMKLN